MNFNVYMNRQTSEELERLAKRRNMSRNTLIREALANLLDRQPGAGWPEAGWLSTAWSAR